MGQRDFREPNTETVFMMSAKVCSKVSGGGCSHPRTGLSLKFPGYENSAGNFSNFSRFSGSLPRFIDDVTQT
jgi:hypothetical protein